MSPDMCLKDLLGQCLTVVDLLGKQWCWRSHRVMVKTSINLDYILIFLTTPLKNFDKLTNACQHKYVILRQGEKFAQGLRIAIKYCTRLPTVCSNNRYSYCSGTRSPGAYCAAFAHKINSPSSSKTSAVIT